MFHELGHVLQQRIKVHLVTEKKKTGLETDTRIQKLESDEDPFSRNTIIPEEEYAAFLAENRNGFSADAIQSFVEKLNILPEIVVGRLQQDRYLSYQINLNRMKDKYVIS